MGLNEDILEFMTVSIDEVDEGPSIMRQNLKSPMDAAKMPTAQAIRIQGITERKMTQLEITCITVPQTTRPPPKIMPVFRPKCTKD